MNDTEFSVKMIEQRFLMIVLEYQVETILIAICFSNTELRYNYVSNQYDRIVKKISGKANLKSHTKKILDQSTLYLPFLEQNKDFVEDIFDLAFEKALATVLIEGYIKEEQQLISLGRKLFVYSITSAGIDHYFSEIKPIFSGLFRKIDELKISEAEKGGIEKWLRFGGESCEN